MNFNLGARKSTSTWFLLALLYPSALLAQTTATIVGRITDQSGGRWQLAGNAKYGSGNPFNVVSGEDFTLQGTGRGTAPERPNISGIPALSGSRSDAEKVTKYFNTSVLSPPAPATTAMKGEK